MTKDRSRLLLVTQNLELSGAQRQMVELASGLDRNQYDVRVGTLESGGPLHLNFYRIALSEPKPLMSSMAIRLKASKTATIKDRV